MFLDVSAWYEYPEHRTLRNTNRTFFNCGGYALSQLGWYWPAADEAEQRKIEKLFKHGAYDEADKLMVDNIFRDFPELLEIKASWVLERLLDYRKFEIIAFRTAHNSAWDFHFRKLGANGRWYEKCGSDPQIYNLSYDSVFEKWDNRYDGKIYFFARKRTH